MELDEKDENKELHDLKSKRATEEYAAYLTCTLIAGTFMLTSILSYQENTVFGILMNIIGVIACILICKYTVLSLLKESKDQNLKNEKELSTAVETLADINGSTIDMVNDQAV